MFETLQATSVGIMIGPFMTSAGVPNNALTITKASVWVSKNHSIFALKSHSASCAADSLALGWYQCFLDGTDTGTLGDLVLYCNYSGVIPVWREGSVRTSLDIYSHVVANQTSLVSMGVALASLVAVNATQTTSLVSIAANITLNRTDLTSIVATNATQTTSLASIATNATSAVTSLVSIAANITLNRTDLTSIVATNASQTVSLVSIATNAASIVTSMVSVAANISLNRVDLTSIVATNAAQTTSLVSIAANALSAVSSASLALTAYDAPTKAEMDALAASLALTAYDAPTKAEMDAGFAALNDIAAADVWAVEVDDSMAADDALQYVLAYVSGDIIKDSTSFAYYNRTSVLLYTNNITAADRRRT